MRTLPLTYKIKRATKGLHGNVYKFPKKDAVLNQFGFNGQLKDNEIYGEGNAYTAEFWEYDPRSIRRWNRDPVRKPWITPYHALSNKLLINIDPNGDDDGWVEDKENNTKQFDPSINSQSDIDKIGGGNRFKYLGVTYQETTERGTVDYRKDGSILYSNRTDGYNRIWKNSFTKLDGYRQEREHLGFATQEGLLVLPDYKNTIGSSYVDLYGYNLSDGFLYDPVSKRTLNIYFSIHSHPGYDYTPTPSGSDQAIGAFSQANKPYLILSNFDNIPEIYGGVGGLINNKRYNETFYPKDFGLDFYELMSGKKDFGFHQPKDEYFVKPKK